MIQRSILHIGFHKTGSTSIQAFLGRFRGRLAELGLAVYEGMQVPDNHVELQLAITTNGLLQKAGMATRPVLQALRAGYTADAAYRSRVEDRIRRFAESAKEPIAVFSSEAVSVLRTDEQLCWLKSVLPGPVSILAYLREPQAYLEAFRATMKLLGVAESDDPTSVAYVKEDTWLADYEARLAPFRRTFGTENVVVIDYDERVAAEGTVIPSFLRVLGVEAAFQKSDWDSVFMNRRRDWLSEDRSDRPTPCG